MEGSEMGEANADCIKIDLETGFLYCPIPARPSSNALLPKIESTSIGNEATLKRDEADKCNLELVIEDKSWKLKTNSIAACKRTISEASNLTPVAKKYLQRHIMSEDEHTLE